MDIFKPGVIGSNLKAGIIQLVNGIKHNLYYPDYLQWANITTIYKNKGSRLSLDSDRGIFVTSILKKTIDQLIYYDKCMNILMEICQIPTLGEGEKRISKIICS